MAIVKYFVKYLKEAGADINHQDKVWECVN